jgi:hypothetical protein
MSATAQNLYFHLGMEADDDGFAPFTKISKMLGTSPDDMAQLLARGFLLQFPMGVFVIRDWKVNNEIRADRYQPTMYQKELSCLKLNQMKQYYIEKQPLVLPNDNQVSPQVRLGKDSIEKREKKRISPPKSNELAEKIVTWYNKATNSKIRNAVSISDNLEYWSTLYNEEDIKKAFYVINKGLWWCKDPELSMIFRRKNPRGERVDYIGELVNIYDKQIGGDSNE